jgi:hypothetical protein
MLAGSSSAELDSRLALAGPIATGVLVCNACRLAALWWNRRDTRTRDRSVAADYV